MDKLKCLKYQKIIKIPPPLHPTHPHKMHHQQWSDVHTYKSVMIIYLIILNKKAVLISKQMNFEQNFFCYSNEIIIEDPTQPKVAFEEEKKQKRRIFGEDDQDSHPYVEADKLRAKKEAIFHSDAESGMIDDYLDVPEENQIKTQTSLSPSKSAKEDERSTEERQVISSRDGSAQPSGEEDNKKGGKGKRKDGSKFVNNYPTKNLMSFFWTKTVNFLEKHSQIRSYEWWQQMKAKTGSRDKFNILFTKKQVQDAVEQLFESKYYYRMIMLSAIDAETKKLYLTYLRKIYRGYEIKGIPYIN